MTGEGASEPSTDRCFAELRPYLDYLLACIAAAPLAPAEREELALLVAAYTHGIVAGVLGLDPGTDAGEVAARISAAVQRAPVPPIRPPEARRPRPRGRGRGGR